MKPNDGGLLTPKGKIETKKIAKRFRKELKDLLLKIKSQFQIKITSSVHPQAFETAQLYAESFFNNFSKNISIDSQSKLSIKYKENCDRLKKVSKKYLS